MCALEEDGIPLLQFPRFFTRASAHEQPKQHPPVSVAAKPFDAASAAVEEEDDNDRVATAMATMILPVRSSSLVVGRMRRIHS